MVKLKSCKVYDDQDGFLGIIENTKDYCLFSQPPTEKCTQLNVEDLKQLAELMETLIEQ
jgi:hypothetical protein